MSLPDAWTQIPVIGDYREITGELLAGKLVSFVFSRSLAFNGQQNIAPGYYQCKLDSEGKVPAGFALPALDHPLLNDTTGTYTVKEHWAGGRTFSIGVSIADSVVNMATVSPVDDPQVWESAEEAALASALGVAATAAKDAAETAAVAATNAAISAAEDATTANDAADASAVSAAASAASAESSDGFNAVKGTIGKKYRAIGCVIRQDSAGSGWYFIDDGNHTPIGVASLAANPSGTLTLLYDFTASVVGTLNVTPDEGYAAVDLTIGASVSKDGATFSLYAPFEARMSNLGVAWGNYITTVSGEFSVDTSTALIDGKVVFTHPGITHTDSSGSITTVERYVLSGVTNGNAEVVVSTQTKSGFTLQAMDPIAAKVAVDASGAISVTHELVTAPAATWDSATNRLTISHALSTSPYAFSVQEITSSYKVNVISSTGAALTVEFYNAAGVKYTGATAPPLMQFVFTRAGNAPSIWSASNRLLIRRGGKCKVRAQDVSGASSNFWIYGAMEVL